MPMLRPHPLRSALLCAWPLLAAGPAPAQTAAEPQTIVVTGSAIEQKLIDAPASISVITREELDKRPVQDVAELLGTVPGVTLSRSGNLVPGIQIRGLGQAYTLMLIDGKRVNSTSASFRGNDYDSGWVPVEEIERIEVVRGPMSSLYGSDAIGGVVNIITRKVGKAWRGSLRVEKIVQENELAGDSTLGSFSLSGPLLADVLGFKLWGGADQREADSPALNPAPAAGGTAPTAMPLLNSRSYGAQLAWTPAEGQSLLLDADGTRRNHGNFVLERETRSLRHQGRYGFGRSELTLSADETRNLTGTVDGQINPNRSNTTLLDGKLTLPLPAWWQTLTVGGELRRDKLHDPANLAGAPGTAGFGKDPTTRVQQHALFVEDELRLGDDTFVTLGLRHDDHENFGGHDSPRAYLVHHLAPWLTIKAGWARAFRAPTLLQGSPNWGSVSCGSATVGCYIVGSTALQPETSTSSEIGLLAERRDWGAGLTVYQNKLRNMIDITNRTANKALAPTYDNFVGFLPDGRPIFRYQNIASVETRGAELSGRVALGAWKLRANYSYTDARNTSGAVELPLTYRSKHAANVGLDWQAGAALSLAASARFSGKQYISVPASGLNLVSKPGYTIADVSLAWTLNPQVTLRGGVLNLADRTVDRLNSNDFNEDGRRWFFSLAARF
ncbi:MAG: TonB-dependent receptor [Rubrivivax sp.]